MYANNINSLVKKLKNRYKTINPFEIAAMCGIIVVRRHFNNLKGMYTVQERCCFIFLSDELDEYMEEVVMFHELGHHFLHRREAVSTFKEHSLYNMSSILEIEANTFAANYIITDEDVIENAELGLTTYQTAKVLCVPHDILLIKMKDMNKRGYSLNIPYIPRSDILS